MNRHGTYSWNVPCLYLFCLWVIYGFLAKTPTNLTREHIPKNNRIPVPLLPPYSLDGWNTSINQISVLRFPVRTPSGKLVVVLPIRGLRLPGVHRNVEILQVTNTF